MLRGGSECAWLRVGLVVYFELILIFFNLFVLVVFGFMAVVMLDCLLLDIMVG